MTIEISTEMQNMTLAPTDNKSFFGSTSQRQLTQNTTINSPMKPYYQSLRFGCVRQLCHCSIHDDNLDQINAAFLATLAPILSTSVFY